MESGYIAPRVGVAAGATPPRYPGAWVSDVRRCVYWRPCTAAAVGSWVGPFGYFRVFAECHVVGCLLFAPWAVPRWMAVVMFAGGTVADVGAWGLSVIAVGGIRSDRDLAWS